MTQIIFFWPFYDCRDHITTHCKTVCQLYYGRRKNEKQSGSEGLFLAPALFLALFLAPALFPALQKKPRGSGAIPDIVGIQLQPI